ncbi:tRNA pseudouridine38-40 synthase [Actinopolymorpha cephalotaxi]|uniref:tRNA pseudouridine synthase A n=1 Tax=Actinopolymorpha cephalotaxi TaxID=504797 RepID=A0A1I2V3L1_9ACTN|nr:tRNA pseudouridine38-40 synthase [Actinopolymorpha cephalotaxi]SFG84025.1 tRNA pseudouridine38-40 synthase [Actinopolymorpha cephalotaxi]
MPPTPEAGGLACLPGERRDPGEGAEPGERDERVVRLRLDVAYDGTDFAGWAAQPGQRTVQGELEEALVRVLRLPGPAAVTCAGRTDAGVHARGQVCHLDVPSTSFAAASGRSTRSPERALTTRLLGALPPDVRVRDVRVAPPGFDARFSALWRRYAYRVCADPAAEDPVRRHEVLQHHRRPLDLAAMNAAAGLLLGEHDFAAFCRRREGATTIRRLLELGWDREPSGMLVCRVVADAFCHSMVRALVGALLRVGEGGRPAEWPARVLSGRVRDSGVHVVPARGLTLEEVGYPPAAELAARAEQARRRRTPAP